ncbi:BON domain-containing protein [Planctobacterium marinum]|uniref:BON domain-containing protein n=1 Tax=Planctobacterium marinum TaxID=1631968 RepID=A0AA48KN75_9ALTE|nr:BON domain-containing protein [Planctobacterium marinum]
MKRIILLLSVTWMLSGCAAVIVGGAAVSTISVNEDPRTIGAQIDDTTIGSKVKDALSNIPSLKQNANINVHVYNGAVLLTGQAQNGNLKAEAERLTSAISGVARVHNQVRIANSTAITTQAHDVWLSNKVRASLLTEKEVNSLKLDVVVEDSEVFLMGIVSAAEARKAVEVTRNIGGVSKVYNILEIDG